MSLKLGLVLGLALVGAILGWRSRKRRRSFYDEQPFGMSDARYEQHEQRRVLYRRLASSLLYAIVGAVAGWLIGLLLFRLP
jgi:hypothetical protein